MKQLNFIAARKNAQKRIEEIKDNRSPVSLLLDGLSDARNIGAMFRIADAARLKKIYLHNTLSIERHKKLKHYSRSTLPYVPYEHLSDLEAIAQLKNQYRLIALEWTNKSIPYTQFKSQEEIILVIGSEKAGVSEAVLHLVSASIHIPMLGINTSMNVAVATGIATYHLIQGQF